MKRIVLYGAGGFGREVAYMIDCINYSFPGSYWFLGFVVGKEYYEPNQVINGYPVLGTDEWLLANKDVYCVCTIADIEARAEVQERLSAQGVMFETLIAPYLPVPPSAVIGKGCVISGQTMISVNTKIGDGVFINSNVTLGHDVTIGNYCTVMPGTGISGNCTIGDKTFVGGHAFIVPGRKIGNRATVAAGSIVFTNVKEGTTVLGNPAKRIEALEG